VIRDIVQNGNTALRSKAESLSIEEIRSSEIQTLISDMHETLAAEESGVALAAPQVGVSKQIFVVHPKVFEEGVERNLVFINPKIVKHSRGFADRDEGCLSIRKKYGIVPRHEKVVVRALDENGVEFTRGASELLAHLVQHEIDHLNGVLFIDKATEMIA